MAQDRAGVDHGTDPVRNGTGTAGRATMSDTPQESDGATQEGGYGFPTLEQEVTPEFLAAAGAESDGSDETAEGGDEPAPGEPVADPTPVEPTD